MGVPRQNGGFKTRWTSRRLTRLADHYNRRFWRGTLPPYLVLNGRRHRGLIGFCCRRSRTIWINVRAHASDQDVRGTVLHELSHAVGIRGHGSAFIAELWRLRLMGAPLIYQDRREATVWGHGWRHSKNQGGRNGGKLRTGTGTHG